MKKMIFQMEDNLHSTMKSECAKAGMSMVKYIIGLIKADLISRGLWKEQ